MKNLFQPTPEQISKRKTLREKLYTIIFETNTPQGKRFDLFLLAFIVFSILILFIESLPNLGPTVKLVFYIFEWILSSIFVIEYLLRIWVSPKPRDYILSAWGVIDLVAILPIFFLPFADTVHFFRIIRIVRLIRLFYIFKVNRFTKEAYSLYNSLKASIYKIAVFMFFVVILAVIMGGLMFVVEGGDDTGFRSVPQSIYWAIVTITTVGFGDITPVTDFGKFLASIMMLLGYAIIAVPTGIVTSELVRQRDVEREARRERLRICMACETINPKGSNFCSNCGKTLTENKSQPENKA